MCRTSSGICPGLSVLVTSRERLGIAGERTLLVPPLGVRSAFDGDIGSNLRPGEVSEAEELFAQRALEVAPSRATHPGDGEAIAGICARLEGLPLAIELAAARVNVLPPRDLLARLDRRVSLLTAGPRDAPSRHRTLRAAIAWSVDLLDPEARGTFLRLAVFADGCPLDGALRVAIPSETNPEIEGVDILSSLVSKSLLRQDSSPDGTPRFWMLETVREFALEQLEQDGADVDVRDGHAAWVRDLFEEASPRIAPMSRAPESGPWLARLRAEHENLRTALAWLASQERWHDVLRLAADAVHFWEIELHPREGRSWLEGALAATHPDQTSPLLRARALRGLGLLSLNLGDLNSADESLREALNLWQDVGDALGAATTMRLLAYLTEHRQDEPHAAIWRRSALDLFVQVGDAIGESAARDDLARAAVRQGSNQEAWKQAQLALAAARAGGNPVRLLGALTTFGEVAAARGAWQEATDCLREGLELAHDLGTPLGIHDTLSVLAAVALGTGQPETAARLLGAASLLAETRELATVTHHALISRTRAAAATTLGDHAFAAAWNEGRELPVASTIEVGLTLDASQGGQTPVALTPRQQQILALLVAGETNHAIAERLNVSSRTVEYHVARILELLGVRTRTAAAAAAISSGLVHPSTKN